MDVSIKLTAVFEKADEGGFIAYIEEIPGANTQGETLEEAKTNLAEALQMVLDANKLLSSSIVNSKGSIKENLLLAS
jgi:predicted RNase H-like HicB family nuclease